MNYYDNTDDYHSRGIDYDLHACLEYNPQEGFEVTDIAIVLAVWEGENDGDDWRWILRLTDGRFIFLQGGCDYTGWDCQSWATHVICDTPIDAADKALGDIEVSKDNHPANAGLGHMISLLGGSYSKNFSDVRDSLLKQVEEGKNKTWTESKNEEFGLIGKHDKKQGLYDKYTVTKTDGSPVDPKATYFVLRLDADKAARQAMAAYIQEIHKTNSELAFDLTDVLAGCTADALED